MNRHHSSRALCLLLLVVSSTACRTTPARDTTARRAPTASAEASFATVERQPSAAHPIAPCPTTAVARLLESIDDFDQRTRLEPWFFYSDRTPGAALRPELDSHDAPNRSLHLKAEGFHQWGSGFGVRLGWVSPAQRSCEVDASAYSGIRFRARGRGGLRVAMATTPLVPIAEGGGCDRGQACYDLPGVEVALSGDWQTFELSFCELVSAGWGSSSAKIDPQHLYALHFRMNARDPHEVWLDDVAFVDSDAAHAITRCGPACPLSAVPSGARVEPGYLAKEHAAAGLQVHTFEQPTKSCGALTRRYLDYVPRRLPPNSSAPLLILLHGRGANAEAFRDFQTHARFEALSERDGFIVVYANAAPGATTNVNLPNSGTWQQPSSTMDEIDDVDYLNAVWSDLRKRNVVDGKNAVFLIGQSSGGGMAIEAARRNPERYSGFAAFMPYVGQSPSPPLLSADSHLSRILFAYSLTDPGLPKGYSATLQRLTDAWAAALALPSAERAAPARTRLADRVDEGTDYTGSLANALATRRSRAEQLDLHSEKHNAALRILIFDHAGHFWPNPSQDTASFALERWGLRNQDLDAADASWDFLRQALR